MTRSGNLSAICATNSFETRGLWLAVSASQAKRTSLSIPLSVYSSSISSIVLSSILWPNFFAAAATCGPPVSSKNSFVGGCTCTSTSLELRAGRVATPDYVLNAFGSATLSFTPNAWQASLVNSNLNILACDLFRLMFYGFLLFSHCLG